MDSVFLFIFNLIVNCIYILILLKMNKFQRETIKDRLLRLAVLRSTGTPAELALRLEISERSVKRYVKEMRDEGKDIRFSQSRGSYVAGGEYQ